MKGNEPKEPALTLPDSLSPSTVPVKSRVMGMGDEILADHVTVLPSTLPFSSGPEPLRCRLRAGQHRAVRGDIQGRFLRPQG